MSEILAYLFGLFGLGSASEESAPEIGPEIIHGGVGPVIIHGGVSPVIIHGG